MIVLLGGQIAAGKTTVAEIVAGRTGGRLIRVRQALAQVLGQSLDDRLSLQRLGADLDRRTAGRWLAEYLVERAEAEPVLIVDSFRTPRQTSAVLASLPDARLVYLSAGEQTRRGRYASSARTDRVKAGAGFDEAAGHDTERQAVRLRALAHASVETDDLTATQVADEVLRAVGWPERAP